MTAANALLQAIHARLSADAALTALLSGNAISVRLVNRTILPALVIGEMVSDDYSTATEPGEEHSLTLEVRTEAQGGRLSREIAARVRALLDDAALPLSGHALVSLLHRSTRVRREPKTRCHVADIRFRAVTE